jgi:hypothetical protein
MNLLWITSRNSGHVDNSQLTQKPTLSFEFEYICVNDMVAEYCPKERVNYPHRLDVPEAEMIADFANRPLTESQLAEVTGFYKNFPRPQPAPTFDAETQRCFEDGTEVIDGLTYKKWVVVQKTAEELAEYKKHKMSLMKSQIVEKSSSLLHEFVVARGYDSIVSACSYVASTNPKFAAEAQQAIVARDATWSKLYEILAEVEAGTRPTPTSAEEVIAELPALVWDAV